MDAKKIVESQQQQMQQQGRLDRGFAIAAVLQSIPNIVYIALVTIIGGFLILAIWFNHASLETFTGQVLVWLGRILIASGVVLLGVGLYKCYRIFHTVRLDIYERRNARAISDRQALLVEKQRLQNQQLEVKIQLERQLPAILKYALECGHNIEYDGKGLRVANYLSNVHTLGNGTSQNLLNAPGQGLLAAPVQRLTIDDICSHIERNSYQVFIGSSLTRNFTPVAISIKGRHIKIIGATQKGKTSMVAALIEIVSRTHDSAYVQFALLDKEYQASRLFEDIPHLLTVVAHDRAIPLHAKSTNEVVEHLGYLLQILEDRNRMSRTALAQEPIIIVCIEEFLRLKKELQSAIATSPNKEDAARRYARFSFAIGQLAGLGLKLRMQLWLCAQMDYADKDKELQEAMVNITSGLSFCVRQTAALAAGFYNTELLSRNAQENQAGQAVCEMPDCNDLILAPDFDLEQRLQEREQAELEADAQASELSYTGPYLLRTPEPLRTIDAYAPPSSLTSSDTPPALPSIRQSTTRKATLADAIEVWNACESEIGRPRLREELQARGLECSDDLAKTLLKGIRQQIASQAGGGSGA